jgi:hypothetical protein
VGATRALPTASIAQHTPDGYTLTAHFALDYPELIHRKEPTGVNFDAVITLRPLLLTIGCAPGMPPLPRDGWDATLLYVDPPGYAGVATAKRAPGPPSKVGSLDEHPGSLRVNEKQRIVAIKVRPRHAPGALAAGML